MGATYRVYHVWFDPSFKTTWFYLKDDDGEHVGGFCVEKRDEPPAGEGPLPRIDDMVTIEGKLGGRCQISCGRWSFDFGGLDAT